MSVSKAPLRIALITPWDLEDPDAWSGMIQPMRGALSRYADVVDVPTSGLGAAPLDRALARVSGTVLHKEYLVSHALATSIRRGRKLGNKTEVQGVDVLLGIVASQELAFLSTRLPKVSVSDATLPGLTKFYPGYSNLAPSVAAQGRLVEKRSWKTSARCLVSSDWARDSLVRDYEIEPGRCRVVPFGPAVTPPDAVTLRHGPREPMRLLAVIRDWSRKQGDLVIQAFRELNDSGFPAVLSIVGPVPNGIRDETCLQFLGELPHQTLASVYREHDVMLDLALANASAVTLLDAAAFALPVVATDVGGVRSVVDAGITGYLVPADESTVPAVVQALQSLCVRETYAAFAKQARTRYLTALNWDVWAAETVSECEAAKKDWTMRALNRPRALSNLFHY